jgi:site-specific recombinase XerD
VDIGELAVSHRRALTAAASSRHTVANYEINLRLFREWLAANGFPTDVAEIGRDHVRRYIEYSVSTRKGSTAHNRFRQLRTFFRWLEDEGEIEQSPMRNVTPPKYQDAPVKVVTPEEMHKLLGACKGNSFKDRRATAILRLLYDTGLRRAEIAALLVEDVDLDNALVTVRRGKGGRSRIVPFGSACALALDRYLRARSRHKAADNPQLWLGMAGPMTYAGIEELVRKLGRSVGLERLHCHMFRHSFADAHLANGGSEGDLMRLCGWHDRTMLDRYGASRAEERARLAYNSPGDRLLG